MRVTPDADDVLAAQERVMEAAHHLIGTQFISPDNPHLSDEVDLAGDELALAARDLVRAINLLDPNDQPVGWSGRKET